LADPFVAIVTGASSGIGEATARRLAREPGARLVLLARRRDRLDALAREIGGATVVAVDLTTPEAPAEVLDAVARAHGELHLLVNNAGGSWRGGFAETGWENVERHMRLNFEAPVRLTEALLPLLRATAEKQGGASRPIKTTRAAIVNVSSTSGRVGRPRAGAYSASKFAIAGWTDSLAAEESPHGVHVGLVLPGFIATEGFPTTELLRHPVLRLAVSKPDKVAEAIVECGLRGKAERYVPRYYWVAAAARILAPGLVRRATSSGTFTTATAKDSQH
jgi:short-subunit dehydrogenase